MTKDLINKTFEVEATPEVMDRFERLLALMQHASAIGHTSMMSMPLDGDGPDRFKVKDLNPKLNKEAELIMSVGYDIEVALSNKYSGMYSKPLTGTYYFTTPNNELIKRSEDKEDQVIKKL